MKKYLLTNTSKLFIQNIFLEIKAIKTLHICENPRYI